MLNLDKLCKSFEESMGWPYVTPGTNDEHGIDCSGMFVRAFRQQGANIYHGSNTIWRKYMATQMNLTSVSQLVRGMAVFKWKADGAPQNDGQGNFCHIGLVTSVNPLRIVHASTEGMRVKADTKLGKWKKGGLLADVDYGTDGSSAPNPQSTTPAPVVEMASSVPTLRRGSRGADVHVLQQALCAAGYTVETDGIFGRETRDAVISYQRDRGLAPDGVVGPMTWHAMGVNA